MSYKSWFDEHAKKHANIVKKLVSLEMDKDEIIEYFFYENMVKNEKDFCLLYAQNKKCHDMKELNCYFCACPNFRFNDAGIKELENKTQYSFCDINSKDGSLGIYGDKMHQDCSLCKVPHHKEYIVNNFHTDWREVMKECCYRC
jgi:hypothetical protein